MSKYAMCLQVVKRGHQENIRNKLEYKVETFRHADGDVELTKHTMQTTLTTNTTIIKAKDNKLKLPIQYSF